MKESMTKYDILKQYYGYEQFREGQETLIDSILAGKDTLGIMPTGAGKSVCYQVPALLMEGITLVISPLISLMKDQVKALNEIGVHAAYLNSSLTERQYQEALRRASLGQYKIIYVAPERLETERFLEFALHTGISMVSVDEAHCISQWGQDFRPSYLKIVDFIERLPHRPIVSAFTATATQVVRENIVRILKLREPTVLTTGFDRSNLFFSVVRDADKYKEIRRYVAMHEAQSGIIYCSTRKNVEELCDRLMDEGFAVTRYHAGLSDEERRRNQDDFIYDVKPVMVATNAFGMGIDKSNVRYVLHYNMPKNMESYYQEAGRAGRDGEPAECILYYSGQDVITNQLFIEHNRDNRELDAGTLALVQEQDRIRLKKMTFYCFTNECLRDYILRYFGEYGENYCGNCSNCLHQFENVDITGTAETILTCIRAGGQRYGSNVIIDTLHGANTAKIRQYRMNENPCYGHLSKHPVWRLRQILNFLLLQEYLRTTEDEYLLLKLTAKGQDFLRAGSLEREPLWMKLPKEQEAEQRKKKTSGGGKKAAGRRMRAAAAGTGETLTSAQEELFEQLRLLRMELAKEEQVPPYIIFSDKTLVDMCRRQPADREQMLEVLGVGEFKLEKYGDRFLQCIRSHC